MLDTLEIWATLPVMKRAAQLPNPELPSAVATRAIRRRLEISQQELARRAGVERVEIIAVEKGRNRATSARVSNGLARGFGLSTEMMELVLRGDVSAQQAIGAMCAAGLVDVPLPTDKNGGLDAAPSAAA